jgi:hypothetical protein
MTTQGQMLEHSERGKILIEIIKEIKPKNVVEIGTWKGLGSTKCIIDSIDNGSNFISIESNYNFYNVAKNNLTNYLDKVNLVYGTIVTDKDVNEFVSDKNLTEEQKKWLLEDLENLSKCENIIESIPPEIDFLLLDGGEFSTYSEWQILKSRTKMVALDDIIELKTKQIYEELINDDNYELVIETPEGNGFCVFIKK